MAPHVPHYCRSTRNVTAAVRTHACRIWVASGAPHGTLAVRTVCDLVGDLAGSLRSLAATAVGSHCAAVGSHTTPVHTVGSSAVIILPVRVPPLADTAGHAHSIRWIRVHTLAAARIVAIAVAGTAGYSPFAGTLCTLPHDPQVGSTQGTSFVGARLLTLVGCTTGTPQCATACIIPYIDRNPNS